ncbi:hypothetical protein AIOL_002283 [Candidatus Rhodobacter oscarellae]|uniref:Carrier domain-containing protein n=1 Tax=Candidatus Rhodobacter oscarellae TaxID=1675527 RepID=A0A0J9E3P0_9RHOB|nr:phosphopantetheine-binding protein [Candidatus Rhodobacter lobularis]KMW57322.1 hypothetical protein AIOL_002283 [Candidatus Rhodobacter lobularis]
MSNNSSPTQKLENELLDIVADETMVERALLKPDARLEDLDIASADFVLVLLAIEEKYGIYIPVDNEISTIETVQDLLTLATQKIAEEKTE